MLVVDRHPNVTVDGVGLAIGRNVPSTDLGQRQHVVIDAHVLPSTIVVAAVSGLVGWLVPSPAAIKVP